VTRGVKRDAAPSVHVYGMAGHNLGDDAIAVVANRELHARLPSVTVRSATLVPGVLRERYGVPEFAIDRRTPGGLLRLVQSVAQADAVVVGGGTLVQDTLGLTRLRGNLAYLQQIAWLARLFRKPLFSVGLGVDELSTDRGRRYASYVLRAARFHYLRDAYSAELAGTYAGAGLPPTVVGGDPAIRLDLHPPERPHDRAPIQEAGRYLVISLVHENLDVESWLPALRDAADALQQRRGVDTVVLLAMDRRPGEERQRYAALADRFAATGRQVRTIVPGDAYEALAWLRGAQFAIAMRLHAMILGLGATPLVAISRTTKTDTFASDAEIPVFDVRRVPEPSALAAAVLDRSERRDALKRQLELRREMQASAAGGFDRLAAAITDASRVDGWPASFAGHA
jgi:polysaccharide pyruvyl transferase WcaK-like protein